MDPISDADRIVLLLRQKLREREKTLGAGTTARRKASDRAGDSEATGIRALLAIDGVDDRQLRRTFIQTILTDQFGSAAVNDAKFQQIVQRVTDAIEEDQDTAALLTRVVREFRAG